jgi:hypothetical protein
VALGKQVASPPPPVVSHSTVPSWLTFLIALPLEQVPLTRLWTAVGSTARVPEVVIGLLGVAVRPVPAAIEVTVPLPLPPETCSQVTVPLAAIV